MGSEKAGSGAVIATSAIWLIFSMVLLILGNLIFPGEVGEAYDSFAEQPPDPMVQLAQEGKLLKLKGECFERSSFTDLDEGVLSKALVVAKGNNQVEICDFLHWKGVDFKDEVYNGMSPLAMALLHANIDAVNCGLDHSADVNLSRYGWYIPLYLAVSGGRVEIVERLLQLGADVHAIDQYDHRLLGKLYQNDLRSGAQLDLLRLLRANGVDPHYQHGVIGNAIHQVVWEGTVDQLKILLTAGVDDQLVWQEETPLEYARWEGLTEMVEVLSADTE